MIDWLLRKWEAWLTKPKDGPSLDEWVCASTLISYEDKVKFIKDVSLAGGWVGAYHHPRFVEIQADWKSFKEKRTCPSSERSR